ncbi:MAG: hypothetical protein ACRD8K_05980 [Nitrososphaeraceae archaeon]
MKESVMKKIAVSSIPSSYVFIITLVYALLGAIFFEFDNVSGEEDNINVNDGNDADNKSSFPQLIDAPCKSPCPSTEEMCIQMCA